MECRPHQIQRALALAPSSLDSVRRYSLIFVRVLINVSIAGRSGSGGEVTRS